MAPTGTASNALKNAKFDDNRAELVNLIKTAHRLESKPTYGLAEKLKAREEKEHEAFESVMNLVDDHEKLEVKVKRF